MIPRLGSLPVVKSEAIMERKSTVFHAMIGKKSEHQIGQMKLRRQDIRRKRGIEATAPAR